ncbi:MULTISPECIES: hypothetical protein [Paenibacillus]|jgi:hypothetical protein|uniref:hypothetical protein n=1 Tax=Paenibacillus TaxID=44249 RepID=UPI00096D4880|nr:hypothetical protein [Paenibacillus odorifer]OMD08374.1 hypothetical protein BJP50_07225 [Paenibacillus odorifer]
MGKFKPVSRVDERMSDMAISIDKEKRILLNANFKRKLGIEKRGSLYLFYDEDEQRIGVSKECEDDNVQPFNFDERGYTSARGFLSWCEFNVENGSIKLIFDGMEGNVYGFRIPGRKSLTLQQEKNGNLERLRG